jgi:hypothetical protein
MSLLLQVINIFIWIKTNIKDYCCQRIMEKFIVSNRRRNKRENNLGKSLVMRKIVGIKIENL